jgi:hypothetical protein
MPKHAKRSVFRKECSDCSNNVIKTLTATSLMSSFGERADGDRQRHDHASGRTADSCRHKMTLGDLPHFHDLSRACSSRPITQIVAIGPQMTEALAGLERTREIAE